MLSPNQQLAMAAVGAFSALFTFSAPQTATEVDRYKTAVHENVSGRAKVNTSVTIRLSRADTSSPWRLSSFVSVEAYNKVAGFWTSSNFGYALNCSVYRVSNGMETSLRNDPVEEISNAAGAATACNWSGANGTALPDANGRYKIKISGRFDVKDAPSSDRVVTLPLRTQEFTISNGAVVG
ncbi:hypothetical protein ACTVZO_43705 [Streptomyces sp. IBSNAI002]|uniref:hypothetical protein n=1 Tax=Streptomyces sp. IBSNAI002 TaxID=3457500 RepID=UPI003FD548BF